MKRITLFSTLLFAFGIYTSLSAAIIHTDITDVTLQSGGNITIDFNGDGVDFTITDVGFGNVEPGVFFISQDHHLTTVDANEWDVLNGLPFGTEINANVGFYDQGDAYIDPIWGTTSFPTVDTYLGAQFIIGTSTHYGWILVNWNAAGTFTVKSFAYNDVPNEAINAGQTSGNTANTAMIENVSISIFPNPCSELLTINTKELSNVELKIYNLSGELILQERLKTQNKIDVSSLSPGIFVISLKSDQGILKHRIVIE